MECPCVTLPAALSFIRPMEPELLERPPKGGEWGHEVKFDGYRTQVIKDADGIRFCRGWSAA